MFVVSLNVARQQIELGTLTWIEDGSSLNFGLEELLDWPLAEGDVADGIFTAPRRWLMTV